MDNFLRFRPFAICDICQGSCISRSWKWFQMFQGSFYTVWWDVICDFPTSFGNLKKRYPRRFAPWKAASSSETGLSFPATKVLNTSFPRSWLRRRCCFCWSGCSEEQQGAAVSDSRSWRRESNRASLNATHFRNISNLMQKNGNFEGCPLEFVALFGLGYIMTPVKGRIKDILHVLFTYR